MANLRDPGASVDFLGYTFTCDRDLLGRGIPVPACDTVQEGIEETPAVASHSDQPPPELCADYPAYRDDLLSPTRVGKLFFFWLPA